jgi:hypothetical protein
MTEKSIKSEIQSIIKSMMDRVMSKVLIEDPFLIDKLRAEKPLYSALVPLEIFKGSHFERRFVTPFGNVWENLAIVAANYGLGLGIKGHSIVGNINQERLRRIQEVLNNLEHSSKGEKKTQPNWDEELKYILEGKSGKLIPTNIICDVYAEDIRNKKKFTFELKAPLPNSDQTKVSKEKMFKLNAMEPKQIDEAYYALPYNPFGKRENYNWSFPARWFDMKNDEVVLIGDEFWEKIGGSGTYKTFISAINEIGVEYKERIYREYLGIEPPIGYKELGL